ncbi:MAG: serine/threonine protein kinase [Planctomycetes bacterium]|nr:serine/threonine protein kinase [Planctomycetota bacterium]
MNPNPHDTQLARLLHTRGRVPLDALTQHLGLVRAARAGQPNATLAGSLVGGGFLSEPEAAAYVHELEIWLEGSVVQGAVEPAQSPTASATEDQTRPPGPRTEGEAPPTSGDALVWSGEGAGWRPGARIGPYLLGQKLGQGGMGVVFKAQKVETGEVHAIKGLSLDSGEVMLQRFEREVEAQSRVDRHANVVRVHAAGESCGYRYLAMDLAVGGDLQQRLRRTRLTQTESARLVLDLACGLAHVHACGILHRDLKPANVLFDSEGTPKLVDFGLAGLRSGTSSLTRTGDMLGTPTYMAPEQALGDFSKVDERADVYALGVILYECLCGSPPFVGKTVMQVMTLVVSEPAPSLRSHDPTIDPKLEAIVMAALVKEPDERIPTAAEFANRLAEWLVASEAGEGSRGGSKLHLALGVVALVSALALAGALAAGGSPARSGSTPTPASSAVARPTATPTPTPATTSAGSPWDVRAGQRFRLEIRVRSHSEVLLSRKVHSSKQRIRVEARGGVLSVSGGKALLEFEVLDTSSFLGGVGSAEDRSNYLERWKGAKFRALFDAATGAPLQVSKNDLPQGAFNFTPEAYFFAEMGSQPFLLRLLDACFHFFPDAKRAHGETWALDGEPVTFLESVVKDRVPALASFLGDEKVRGRWDGRKSPLELSRGVRMVRATPEGGLAWGREGRGGLPRPAAAGRNARGFATLERGWVKRGEVHEALWIPYSPEGGGAVQFEVEMHVTRSVKLTLDPEKAPRGE